MMVLFWFLWFQVVSRPTGHNWAVGVEFFQCPNTRSFWAVSMRLKDGKGLFVPDLEERSDGLQPSSDGNFPDLEEHISCRNCLCLIPRDPSTSSEGTWTLQTYISSLQSPSDKVLGSLGNVCFTRKPWARAFCFRHLPLLCTNSFTVCHNGICNCTKHRLQTCGTILVHLHTSEQCRKECAAKHLQLNNIKYLHSSNTTTLHIYIYNNT